MVFANTITTVWPLKLFNTQTRQKEDVIPLDGKIIRLYTCGPTVYDFAHIGNFRTFVFEDILCRTIRFFGMKLVQVMNITDVDDKTIRGAIKHHVTLEEFTRPYKAAFFEDLQTLNVIPADHYPEATQYIPQMIGMVEKLIANGLAYKSHDGSIYYSITKFPDYGKLSHLDLGSLQTGSSERTNVDEYSKEHLADFVLWKSYDEERDGTIFWESPFGKGRPGWHLECSVMAESLLGPTLDIHAGGVDLIFPHHENEIAQSEGCNHTTFAKLWVHAEHLLVDHKKMSKSAGNFYTLRDLLRIGYTGRIIRFLLLHTHYRTQLNFTLQGLDAARFSLQRIDDCIARLENYKPTHLTTLTLEKYLKEVLEKFFRALADDLNISEALAVLFEMIRQVNTLHDRSELSVEDVGAILATIHRFDTVLGILDGTKNEIPEDVRLLVDERSTARKAKNWQRSDEIRILLGEKGYSVEDAPDGVRVKRL